LTNAQQALSDNGSPPLGNSDANAISGQLAFLATTVPGTINSPTFSLSTCPLSGRRLIPTPNRPALAPIARLDPAW
jgi:hypothetical protein